MKISGPCGRLLCCLAYEYDHYTEQKQKLPNDGARINYDGSSFQVCDVNVISNRVRLFSRDEGRYITVSGEQLSYDRDGRRWSISGEIPPGE
jgi:cell fate regulator YaaT (PSP1 superfamily)